MRSEQPMSIRALAMILLLTLALAGCGSGSPTAPAVPSEPAPDGPEWFEDVTERWGIHFTHDPGPVDKYWMFQITSAGCALDDFDGDGRLDILFLSSGGP